MAAPATLRLLRRRPPSSTLAWVVAKVAPGGRITRIEPMRRATARAVHAIEIVSSAGETREVVLRRFVPTPESALDPDMDATRELRVLELVARAGIPTPLALAADVTAKVADVPAIVQDRLPGRPPRGMPEPRQLFEALGRLHALPVRDTAGMAPHRRWNDPSTTAVPPWAGDPALWQAAIDIARSPAPAAEGALIHGDFHLGNTLWSGRRLTGIVDWTTASIGPPAADVAQLRWNIAVDQGTEAAEAALLNAERAGLATDPYWDVANVVDLVPDVAPSRPPPPVALSRLECFLRAAVDAMTRQG